MIPEISDQEIKKAREVLESHVVKPLTEEGALECLLWGIASQATSWEKASEFVFNLRKASRPKDKKAIEEYASWELLTDKEKVNAIADKSGLRFAYANRFDNSIEYFENNPLDLLNIPNANLEDRDYYVKNIKYLGRKTFSFWHLCLGGQNLLALDVHVMRQLKRDFGIEMSEHYISSIDRKPEAKHKQRVRVTPGKIDYLEIEKSARKYFSQDSRLLKNGKLDFGLVDSLLWWRGAKREDDNQGYLFSIGTDHEMKMPYGVLEGKADGNGNKY